MLKIVSTYIWMDSRLKGLSIEFKNTSNGVRTKKLWSSEVRSTKLENKTHGAKISHP